MFSLEFIAEQFQDYADNDPVHWDSPEGLMMFGDVPVFYERFPEVFILNVEGIQLEVPRI